MNKNLTLAIPTYNRADILDKTLELIVSDSDFDERVEIVISDNCSTDNTASIVEKYTTKYSNIIYSRNEINIGGELNFCKVLSLGSGDYVKLCNDTVRFKKKYLGFILNKIELHRDLRDPIFFYRNYYGHHDVDYKCQDIDSFLNAVSLTSTWIGNFGVWRSDLPNLAPLNRNAHTLLMQVDWTYQILRLGRSSTVYFRDYFDVYATNDKGGYNVFEIFINNYISYTRNSYRLGEISLLTFEKDKFKLFLHFVCLRVVWLILRDKRITSFENKNSWKIILREYYYYPYFYLGVFLGLLSASVEKIKSIVYRT